MRHMEKRETTLLCVWALTLRNGRGWAENEGKIQGEGRVGADW